MSLELFIFMSAVYVMVVHFALGIKNQFNLFLMIGAFIAGGVVGWYSGSYMTGFFGAIILSLVLW